MRYLNPGNIFKKVRQMAKEIDNYFFYIKQIEVMAATEDAKHYKLHVNAGHGLYGAVNMQPEMLLYYKGEELDKLEKTLLGSELSRMNSLFEKYGLMELYKVEYDRIKDDEFYAYVFQISYKWNHCNKKSIISLIATTAVLLAGIAITVIKLVR